MPTSGWSTACSPRRTSASAGRGHWLDLARYADSDGYEDDRSRPDAWRYRDWVIAAFNRDMPFDRFTIEQLAGDLLPGATYDQRVAAGFHRMTMFNRSADRPGQRGGVPHQDRQGPREHHGHGLARSLSEYRMDVRSVRCSGRVDSGIMLGGVC